MKETAPARNDQPQLLHCIREGPRFLLTHRVLRMIALRSAFTNLSFSAVVAVRALFLVRELSMSPAVYGAALAAGAAGGLIGGAIVEPLSRALGSARGIWLGPVLFQPFALLLSLAGPGVRITCFVVGSFVTSTGVVVYNVSQISYRQATTPERLSAG